LDNDGLHLYLHPSATKRGNTSISECISYSRVPVLPEERIQGEARQNGGVLQLLAYMAMEGWKS
jgi:hypothetical protein